MNNELVRVEITKFLQWNDRNGFYTDEECELEKISPLSYEEAVCYFYYNAFEDIYNENGCYSPGELEYDKCINIAKENNLEFKAKIYIEHILNHKYEKVIEKI